MGIGRPEKNPIKPGDRFGLLVALYIGAPVFDKQGYPIKCWFCKCDCGGTSTVRARALKTGNTKSCGCGEIANQKRIAKKHGHAAGGTVTPEFRAWCKRLDWCYNPNCVDYPDYGGRGIIVCDEWRNDFLAFYNYVGDRPSPEYSLDRIDNNGNYEPGNVRWATIEQQARNRRNNRLLTYNNETHCVAEWEEILGFNKGVLRARLYLGWEGDKLFQPQFFSKRRAA